jgi:hypothetical protein
MYYNRVPGNGMPIPINMKSGFIIWLLINANSSLRDVFQKSTFLPLLVVPVQQVNNALPILIGQCLKWPINKRGQFCLAVDPAPAVCDQFHRSSSNSATRMFAGAGHRVGGWSHVHTGSPVIAVIVVIPWTPSRGAVCTVCPVCSVSSCARMFTPRL